MMDNKNYKISYIENDSYKEYVANQTKTNKIKINNKWVREENIIDIKNYCNKNKIIPKKILCHGTRNGIEMKYFLKHFPGTEITGTEISPTATQFPNTVQWDFHDINEEWIGQFDIVFTNSWDHSYDLKKATDSWRAQLTDRGIMILDWSDYSTSKPFNKSDCCGCSLESLVNFLSEKSNVFYFPTKGFGSEKSYLVIANKNN